MDRPMFKKNGVDPENVGIMAGFKDMEDSEDMPGKMLEMMGAEVEEDEGEDYEGKEAMERSPSSPEILMNNLRGDMRSIDARVEELADLVGYRAANETPTEVLALLQPVLAQQGIMGAAPSGGVPVAQPVPEMPAAGGIGALPQAELPPPIEGAPLNMANGGIVQRFENGSDEEGVTPAGAQTQRFYSPELIQKAQTEVLNFLAQRPTLEPSLQSRMAVREPLYRSVMGDTKDLTQAQILFDIAQGAFGYGANVDEQGRPLRGSQASRAMAAFRGTPGRIAARAGELEKQERAVRLAALQAAEKDVENIRATNVKLVDSQRRVYSDIAKSAGNLGFGRSVKGVALNTMYQLSPQYAAGSLDPSMDRMFETAVNEYTQKEYYTDPDTGVIKFRVPELPQFVKDAIAGRKTLSKVVPSATPASAPAAAPAAAPSAEAPANVSGTTGLGAPTAVTGAIPTGAAAPGVVVPPKGAIRPRTIWDSAPDIAGPIPAAATTIARVPGMGGVAPEMQQSRNFVNAAVRDLIKNLQNNPRYPEGERKAIESEVDIGPRFFDDAEGLRNRTIGIDDFLAKKQAEAEREGYNEQLPLDTRRAYRTAAQSIANFRTILGVPIRIYNIEDVKQLAPGTPFLWNGTEQRVKR